MPLVPEHLQETHRLDGPLSLIIAADYEDLAAMNHAYTVLDEARLAYELPGMLVDTIQVFPRPNTGRPGIDNMVVPSAAQQDPEDEHRQRLISGHGLDGATEVLYMSPQEQRDVSDAGKAWMDQALSAEHIERVHLLQDSDWDPEQYGNSQETLRASGLSVIYIPLEVIRYAGIVDDVSEIGLFDGRAQPPGGSSES